MTPVASESSSATPRALKQHALVSDGTTTMNIDPPPNPKHSVRPQEVDAPARAAFAFDELEDALEAFGRGEFLVVMDDEGRENEGDLIIAASEVSTEKMAWMIKHTRCALQSPRDTFRD